VGDGAVVVAVIFVRMMQMVLHQIVSVIPMRDRLVTASRSVGMLRIVGAAGMGGRTGGRIRAAVGERMLMHVPTVDARSKFRPKPSPRCRTMSRWRRSTSISNAHAAEITREHKAEWLSGILNHTLPGVTGRVYDLYKYDKEKKQGLMKLDRVVQNIVEGDAHEKRARVVRLGGRRADTAGQQLSFLD
jgi:hypothetical protein